MRIFRTIALLIIEAASAAMAVPGSSVQPIVNTGQVLYGSNVKTITSTSTVTIDTTTAKLTVKDIQINGTCTGSGCGSGGGGSSTSGNIVASTQNNVGYYSGIGTNTISGLTAGTSGQILMWGSSGPPFWSSSIGTSTGTLSVSTASLQSQINSLNTSTATIATSTASLQTQVNSLNTSTATIATSTASLQTQINNINTSTATIATSTASLQTQVNALGVSTNTLAVSTGTLYTLANTKLSLSSITATSPVTYNNTTGAFAFAPFSLSTAPFIGALPAANMVSTAAFTNSTQTWTAGQTFVSSITVASTATFNYVSISTFSASSGTVTNLNLTTLQGVTPGLVPGTNIASITGTWPNQTINATTQGGGGSSALSIGTGTASAYVFQASSPTVILNFEGTEFSAALKGGATAYVSLNLSSVTAQGNSVSLAALASSMTAVGLATGTIQSSLTTGLANVATSTAAIGVSTASLQTSINQLTSSMTAVGASTGTIQATINQLTSSMTAVGASTGTIQTTVNQLTSSMTAVGASTGTLQTSVNQLSSSMTAVGASTGTIQSSLTTGFANVATSTAAIATSTTALQVGLNNVATSTAAIAVSTASLQTGLNNVASSTATIATSTASLQTQVNSLNTSTATIATSTASLQTQVTALGVSTNTLAVSTGTLYTLASNKVGLSSITATAPITYNNTTGGIGFTQNFSTLTLTSTFTVTFPTITLNSVNYSWPSSGTVGNYLQYASSNTLQWGTVTASGGSGSGYALQPATVTINANVGIQATTATYSSSVTIQGAGGLGVTYGITAGSITVGPAGSGAFQLSEGADSGAFTQASGKDNYWASSSSHAIVGTFNNSASTYTFVTSSVTPVAGQYLYWASGGPNGWVVGSSATAGSGSGGGGSGDMILASTQTVTGAKTFTSSTTFTGAVLVSTTVILGGSTGTNGQVFTSGGQGAAASWTTLSSAGLASTQTWTGQNNWTTPAQSTFTYGLTVGSLTITNSGAGQIVLTEGTDPSTGTATGNDNFWASSSSHAISGTFNGSASTYTVVTSSITPVAGQYLYWAASGPNSWVVASTATAGSGSGGGGSGGYAMQPATVTINANVGIQVTTITASSSVTIQGAGGLGVTYGISGGTETLSGGMTASSITVTGANGIKNTYGIVTSSVSASSMTATGQITAGTYQGAGLTTCGDSSHALSWTGGTYGCQAITGSSAAGGNLGNVQINNPAGTIGGASDFNVWTSSVVIGKDPSATYTTFISSLAVTSSMTVTASTLTLNNVNLALIPKAAPSGTYVNGMMWHDSTQNAIEAVVGGTTQTLTGTMWTASASSAVFNLSTIANILPTGVGTLTIPGNALTVGKTIHLVVTGTFTVTGTPNMTASVKMGSTVIASTGIIAMVSSISTMTWTADVMMTCYATGASGKIMTTGNITFPNTKTTVSFWNLNGGQVTIDTTASQVISLNFTWGTANAANNVTLTNGYVEIRN